MRRLLISLSLLGALNPGWAQHPDDGQSAEERAAEVAPGPWQGTWRITRDDPRIHTRAGAELAVLHVIQDLGDPALDVSWHAGPAMCEDPSESPPCEWASARGQALSGQHTAAGGLQVVLPVSADAEDPFTLHIPRLPEGDEYVAGTLTSAHGDIQWAVELQRDDPQQ